MFNFGKSTTNSNTSGAGGMPTPSFSFSGGGTPAAPSGGLNFGGGGTTAPAAAPSGGGGLNFGGGGTTAPAAAPTGGGGLNFGGATTATTSASASSFSFGGTGSAPSSGFSLGGAPSSGSLSFGAKAVTTSAPAVAATLGGTSGFSFGGATVATTSTTTSSTTAPSLFSGGGGGIFKTAPTAVSAPTLTSTLPIGLGGSGYNDKKETEKANQAAPQPIKEQHMPPELGNLVGHLENHIKKEKEESSEVAKFSQRQLTKIKENAASLGLLIRSLRSSLQRDQSSVGLISDKASQLQNHIEMAQRTNDTHPSHQYENILPSRYFHELVMEFERKLMIYRSQIDQLESHLAASGDIALAELPIALEKLHQTYIALAASVQILLQALEKLKQKYLNFRRQVFGETTDVFLNKKPKKVAEVKGPSPFAELSNLSVLALAQLSMQNQNQPPNTGFTNPASTGGLFGNTATNQPNTGSSLFGNTSTTQSATGGSLFGNTTQKPGGLFGNTATSASTGGGLFGNTATSTNTGGGLFGNKSTSSFSLGNTTTNNQTTQNTSNTGGGLFGNSTKSGFSFGK